MTSYSSSLFMTRRTALVAAASAGLVSCNGAALQPEMPKTPPRDTGWSMAPSLPEAVQEIYPCSHKGRLHVAGGFTAQMQGQAQERRINGPTAAHYSYSAGEAAWREELALPAARHHPHMISFQGRLLAFAGFESSAGDNAFAQGAWTIQSTGWVMPDNPAQSDKGASGEEQWQTMPALPAPAAEAVIGITGDGALHLAGGRTWAVEGQTGGWRDHIDTDHHFVLTELSGPDLSGSWARAAPCPHRRNSAAGAVINGNLHIIGGRQVGGGNLAHHSVYNYKEDRWHSLAPLPQAQGGLAAASLGGMLYVFGGEFFDNGGGVYPQSWVYDPSKDIWQALPDMPHPRHGLGAVSLGRSIYVIGGAEQASGIDTSARVEVYTPKAKG